MFYSDLQTMHVETSAHVTHRLSLKINIPRKMIWIENIDNEKIIKTLQQELFSTHLKITVSSTITNLPITTSPASSITNMWT